MNKILNMDFCSIFKLTRVAMAEVSKKGEKYGRYSYLKYFYLVVFNRTLTIYLWVISIPYYARKMRAENDRLILR